jgi:hypothetical protein
MMKRTNWICVGTLGVLAIALCVGCQNAESETHGSEHGHTHEPIKGPKTFTEGVTKLKEFNEVISVAMESDDPDAAHDPLHEIGSLLNRLPELAADTDLAESDWEEVNQEVDKLFEAFKEVDVAFHNGGDKKAAYESSKANIDEGVAYLETKLALLSGEHDDK